MRHRHAAPILLAALALAGCRSVTAPPAHHWTADTALQRLAEAPESRGELVQLAYDPNPYFAPVASLTLAQGPERDTLTAVWSASPASFAVAGRELWLIVAGPAGYAQHRASVSVYVSSTGVHASYTGADYEQHTIAGATLTTAANRSVATFPAGELDFTPGVLIAMCYVDPAPGGFVQGYWYRTLPVDAAL